MSPFLQRHLFSGIIFFCCLLFCIGLQAQQKIRIACVGNSITAGARLVHPEKNSYPAQLQNILGDGYEIMNFGVSGKTMLIHTNNPYASTKEYQEALESRPDIVFIKLGTNDTHMPYRLAIDTFITDYKTMVHAFQALPSHPRIILLLPVASYMTDSTKQTDDAITKMILPRVRQVAYEEKLELIDLHSITLSNEDWFPDKLHPSPLGATAISNRLYEAIKNKTSADFDIFKSIKDSITLSSFYGYDCADFNFNGRNTKIVKPRRVAEGMPWVWRARFWGHEPQTDIALLDRGFHIVYSDVAELFGNTEAIERWNKFYAFLQSAGLNKKAVMEGMSRGGVYVYNWAAENPGKVACVYADAPVLDLKSWPGGKGTGKQSLNEWNTFKKDYGYASDVSAFTFKGSPVDKIKAIVKGHYPMLHVVGDADDVVPVNENTEPFEKQVLAMGGDIKVIHKKGIGHHPHSLANPQPIVRFILKAVGNTISRAVVFAATPAPGSEYRSGAGWKEGSDWWDNYNDIQRALDSLGRLDILFLGNSITQGIGKRSLVRSQPGKPAFDTVFSAYTYGIGGISGDRTQHLLWRVEHTDFTKSNPAVVVVTIGVNNFGDDEADDITAGIKNILASIKVKLPQTKVILVGPLPTGNTPAEDRRIKYNSIHQQIKSFADKKTVFLCDPSSSLIDSVTGNLMNGLYSGDGIHLAPNGYRVWANELYKVIHSVLPK